MALSSQTIQDKNALNTDAVLITLLEIQIPAIDEVTEEKTINNIYVTSDNADTIWNGNTYLPFHFEMDDKSFSSKSEVVQWSIKVSNVTRVMEQYVQDYDLFLKQYGIDGNKIICYIRVVNSKDIDNTTPIVEHRAILSQPKTNAQWATFVLSPNNLSKTQFPFRKILKNFCDWKFKSTKCGYLGEGQFCDKTLTTCRTYENSPRFGGFIGVGEGVTLV